MQCHIWSWTSLDYKLGLFRHFLNLLQENQNLVFRVRAICKLSKLLCVGLQTVFHVFQKGARRFEDAALFQVSQKMAGQAQLCFVVSDSIWNTWNSSHVRLANFGLKQDSWYKVVITWNVEMVFRNLFIAAESFMSYCSWSSRENCFLLPYVSLLECFCNCGWGWWKHETLQNVSCWKLFWDRLWLRVFYSRCLRAGRLWTKSCGNDSKTLNVFCNS